MSEQVGAKIKEARNAAGMSQKALAAAVPGVSASDISKAERGEKELTSEQLQAIAAATGAKPNAAEAVQASVKKETPADSQKNDLKETPPNAQITVVLNAAEKELLDLYKASDPITQRLIFYVLKRQKPQMQEVMALLGGLLTNLSKSGENPLAGLMSKMGGNSGSSIAGIMNGIKGMANGSKSNPEGENQKGSGAPGYLMTFTYFYSVTIYIFLLSFYFWLIRKDIKPEKPVMN